MVDNYRLNYIEGLLIQASVQESEAHDRAYLIYAFQISLSLLHSEDTPQERMERNVRMSHILIPERQALPA